MVLLAVQDIGLGNARMPVFDQHLFNDVLDLFHRGN